MLLLNTAVTLLFAFDYYYAIISWHTASDVWTVTFNNLSHLNLLNTFKHISSECFLH